MTADEAREALQRCRGHIDDAVRAVSVPGPDRAACATACARCVSELCELMEAMAWGGSTPVGKLVVKCGICGAPVDPGTRYRIQCVGETGALVGRKPQMVTEWSATMCPRCFRAMTRMREALAERGRAERGDAAVTDRERERRLAASRRGAAAQHAKMPAGPRVDSYERKVDVRAQVAAEDRERRRCRW